MLSVDQQGPVAARKSQEYKQGQPKACAYEGTLAQCTLGPEPVSATYQPVPETISGFPSATGSKERELLGLVLGEAMGESVWTAQLCPAEGCSEQVSPVPPWPSEALGGHRPVSVVFSYKMSLVTGDHTALALGKGSVGCDVFTETRGGVWLASVLGFGVEKKAS